MSSSGNYILMNDIDLSETTFTPIGGSSGSFTGTFDGNGYTITISDSRISSSCNYRGLFGSIGKDGIVKNLNVKGDVGNNAENSSFVGGIAGYNFGTITNCNSYVDINSSSVSNNNPKNTYSGGIAGQNCGTITYCFASGNIYGASYNEGTGGIAGSLYRLQGAPKIEHCIYIGTINKHSNATDSKYGMICGYPDSYSTYITNSYYIDSKGFTGIGNSVTDDEHCTAHTQFQIRALAKAGGIYASTENSIFKNAILMFPYEIHFRESDGITIFSDITGEPANVTFHRSFTNNVKCTVCFPFSIPSESVSTYGNFYSFVGIKEGTTNVVQMQQINTDLSANTAYVFEPTPWGHSEELGITFKNVTIANTLEPEVSSSTFQFLGTYSQKNWLDGDEDLGKVYGFAISGYESEGFTAGQFVKLGAGASAAPFRAYLKYNGNLSDATLSRAFSSLSLPNVLNIEYIKSNNVTDIKPINKTLSRNEWFTLSGQKLDGTPSKKGVYVNNGKKVIVK